MIRYFVHCVTENSIYWISFKLIRYRAKAIEIQRNAHLNMQRMHCVRNDIHRYIMFLWKTVVFRSVVTTGNWQLHLYHSKYIYFVWVQFLFFSFFVHFGIYHANSHSYTYIFVLVSRSIWIKATQLFRFQFISMK